MKYFLIFVFLTIYLQEIKSESCTAWSIQTQSYHVEPCVVAGSFCCGGCSNRYCCDKPEKKLEQSQCGAMDGSELKAPVTEAIKPAATTAVASYLGFHPTFQSILLFLLGLLISLILCCCIPLMCCLCCRDCFRICGFGGKNNNANSGTATYGNSFTEQMRKRIDNFFGTSTTANQNVTTNSSTTNYVSVAQDDFAASQNMFRTNNNSNTVEYHEFSEVRRTFN